ncbi:MAG: hypothetical protein LBT59_10405, partial [Clostridiales bacterium]|jgi:hypothetical protein|nr:hypothetical protein [Clostridiales bacterium]
VIRRKNTNSPFNVIVAYLKEATQSFQKRLLLGFYGEGNYQKLKTLSEWIVFAVTFILFAFLGFRFFDISVINSEPLPKRRWAITALLSVVSGIAICWSVNAMFFRWVGWLFTGALVLSFAFAITSFFVEDEFDRVLSGVAGLIAFVLGFMTVVLLSINVVAFIVMSALVFFGWLCGDILKRKIQETSRALAKRTTLQR